MRILLLSKLDIQGCCNINALLRMLLPRHDVRVALSDDLLEAERGNPHADYCTWHDRDFLCREIFPFLDTLAGRAQMQKTPLAPFADMERRFGAPVQTLEHGRHIEELAEIIRSFFPDLVYSCRFDYIFPQSILDMLQQPPINTHSGRLPDCCGPNAPFRALYQGMAQTACFLHRVTPVIDGGPTLAHAPVPLDYGRCLFWNRRAIYDAGIRAFGSLMEHMQTGAKPPQTEQDLSQRQYYKFPSEEEFREFTLSGKILYHTETYLETLALFFPPAASLPGGSLAAWYKGAFAREGLCRVEASGGIHDH